MAKLNETEGKYIQQHLANERTFLAWIRTVIAILGVGIVMTTLHFELHGSVSSQVDLLVRIIGLLTLVLAFTAMFFAVYSYLKKRQGINTSAFQSTAAFSVFMGVAITIILGMIGSYMIVVY